MSKFCRSSRLCRSTRAAVFLALLSAPGIYAREPPASTSPAASPASALTFHAALMRAEQGNPALAAQQYGGRAAEAMIEQAGLRPNPTLDLTMENFAGSGAIRGVKSLEGTVQMSQKFEFGDKRAKRVALAAREHTASLKVYEVARTDVRALTAIAYVEVLAAQQRLALAAEPLKLARETIAAVETRVKAAVASPVELSRARAALAAAQAECARTEAALAAARAKLAGSWGGSPDDVPALPGEMASPDALPEMRTFLTGLSQNPRMHLQQSVIEGRRAALDLENANAATDITVGAGVRYFSDGTDVGLVAGVSIPVPIFDQNQGRIRAARELVSGAEQTARAVDVELRTAFTAAWQELRASHDAVQSLKRDALPPTEEAYNGVRRAYEQGQLPLIDVLDAQRALASLRRELLDATAAYCAALVRVETLSCTNYNATVALLKQPGTITTTVAATTGNTPANP